MNYLTAAIVGAGIGVVGVWIFANVRTAWYRMRPAPVDDPAAATERQFINVFAIMTQDRRQALLRYYMEKHECSREAAMQMAIDDRERDIRRWG